MKKKNQTIQKTRKEIRKEKRKQKKVNKALHYSKKKSQNVSNADPDPSNENNELNLPKIASTDERKKKRKKKPNTAERQKKMQLKKDNVLEDREIKYLEKQLKLNKRKSKTIPKSFVTDGLDYLLDFCSEDHRQSILEMEKQFLSESEDEKSDVESISPNDNEKDNKRSALDDIDCEGRVMSDNDHEGSTMSDRDDKGSVMSDDDYEGSALSNNDDEESVMSDNDYEGSATSDECPSENESIEMDVSKNEKKTKKRPTKSTLPEQSESKKLRISESKESIPESLKNESDGSWEDIYGRRRDKQGNVIEDKTKYIPPAARQQNLTSPSDDDENSKRLRKQLKGLLNRLAEHNMHIIVGQLDELYMSNSRNQMNRMLSTLIIEALVAETLTPDRLVCEHMLLIAILHANVGIEVGAYFLQFFIKKLDEMLQTPQHVENKSLENLILMISHMYNFKIFAHKLMFEILGKLSDKFMEKEIELILMILKTVGFSLRKDDPLALKEFIIKLQNKASGTEAENARVKFMLDVVFAIKNNNMNKIPQYDPSHVEHLRKIMKPLIRKGNSVVPFNISMDDLLHADERGKWWMIGSAWTGPSPADIEKPTSNLNAIYDKKILNLAYKQRMNTDIRRNIFCIIMTAEDYLDAFEKIHHLGLKDQQEREIVHVMIECCIQEKKFNPYYAVLAQKFCDCDRKYKMMLQYALWDKLKILENYDSSQSNNLAEFLTRLFIGGGLRFTIMKIIDFAELNKPTMKLVKKIILNILLHEDETICLQIFQKIPVSLNLQTFRESLKLFIKHFLLKNMKHNKLEEKQIELLRLRIELVYKILSARESKLMF